MAKGKGNNYGIQKDMARARQGHSKAKHGKGIGEMFFQPVRRERASMSLVDLFVEKGLCAPGVCGDRL